ncbi:hypothetical protein [Streptomyces xanthophaeus]|uniref:hypothetical protein n=1 Tax=Streptomyces xanthophaeus TaxID=67385 RepID=UPI00264770BB|nr:hypothetical protein [Streptomyces xanthophaeus]
MSDDRSFLFVLGSSLSEGNTEILARQAAEQLPAGTRQHWVDLAGSDLPDFQERMAGRTLWGVTAMADHDEARAEGLVTSLHHTAAYMRMHFGGVLLGNGSRPGQVRDDERAAIRAKAFFAQDAPLARFP